MNQKTEKLYYIDTYKKTFTAKVLECDRAGKKYSVVLDRTSFYPEGGGQPSDIGVLNTVNVLEVQEKNGTIIHTTDKPLTVKSNVTGGVNWVRRFSLMQQHTGEHIVSGIIHRLFKLDNVGFHMGDTAITVDFNGELSKDNLKVVEMLANQAVYKNIKLKIWYPTSLQLKQINYRSKKELEGEVRIVTIPGYDTCACCGTHVNRTGEIGIIKILSSQRYKGGTRITMLCGDSAASDYYERVEISNKISSLLSAKPNEIASAVEHLLEENKLLKQQNSSMKNLVLESKAENITEGTKNVCVFEEDLEPNDLRRYCLMLSERCSGFAAVFSGNDEIGYKYAIASENVDVRDYSKDINSKFNGRGGGKQKLVQGSVKCRRNLLDNYVRNL
jgi:alanyl-tRNA synthetase